MKFKAEDTGKQRKLFQPWHGPYRMTAIKDQNVVVVKVYFPKEESMNVHHAHVVFHQDITGMDEGNIALGKFPNG